ncbi:MAG: hypothetical protein LBI94_05950 [Treponema sp.]|jgi:hypothetical protein|nr:hypothetical protein [Treponema sp.]
MNIRRGSLFVFVLLALPCGAQVPPGEGVPFPLSLVLEAVQTGAGCWRPDWPLEIPPDAFAPPGAARIELDAGALPGILERYRLEWSGGRLTDFPLPIALSGARPDSPPEDPAGNPVFVQVHCRYDEGGGLSGIDIEIPGADGPVQAPVETAAGLPAGTGSAESPAGSLAIRFDPPYFPQSEKASGARVEYGDRFYRVLLSGGIHEITETWFDSRGNFSAYFTSRTGPAAPADPSVPQNPGGPFPWIILGIEGSENGGENGGLRPLVSAVFHRESGGNLSEYSGGPGPFSAVYGPAGRPRYWTSGTRNYGFQWDEGGRLVRLRDLGAADDETDPSPVDFRYDYEYDSRGNWVLRRETALFRAGNLLLPAYGRELVRRITYEEDTDGSFD